MGVKKKKGSRTKKIQQHLVLWPYQPTCQTTLKESSMSRWSDWEETRAFSRLRVGVVEMKGNTSSSSSKRGLIRENLGKSEDEKERPGHTRWEYTGSKRGVCATDGEVIISKRETSKE
jgi:hypothetical protein